MINDLDSVYCRAKATELLRRALLSVFCLVAAHVANAAGLSNAGFEDGIGGWSVENSANEIVVVGSEGPGDFDVYANEFMNLTVDPAHGTAQMLRLGAPESPGDQNNNQNDGSTSVTQLFEASTDELLLSVRTFTTEFRPNRDAVRINIVPSDPRDQVSITVDLEDASCNSTTCEIPLDAGRNGAVDDSDWATFLVSGLTTGHHYTLRYELATGGGSSHPSWVYFDDANHPPVADFSLPPSTPLEADYVFFENTSYDPDGDPITSLWTFEGPEFSATQTTQESPPFAFPENGTATVTLTVDDGEASDTKKVELEIVNAPPKVKALNLEVLQGHVGGLVCRDLDPGIYDPSTFEIAPNKGTVGTVQTTQEHDPTLTTGLAIGAFDASVADPATGWTCRVTDGDGGDVTESADIHVLSDAEVALREPANDGCVDADQVARTTLNAGSRYVYAIDQPGDLDCFEIKREDGSALQGNDQVGLLLTDLPADYELVVASLGSSGAGDLEVSPYFTSPYFPSPYFPSPYFPSPYFPSPYFPSDLDSSPYFPSPYFPSPYFPSPYFPSALEGSPYFPSDYSWFPLTQVANLTIGVNNITGKDISVAELGLDSIADEGLTVKTFSAAPFNLDEQIVLSVDPGERLFAIVKGREGSAAGPYTLQVEASQQVPLDAILDCAGTPVVPSDHATEEQELYSTNSGSTLILTPPPERFVALRHDGDFSNMSDWNDKVLPALKRYLDSSAVGGGKIIALPSGIYDDRDTDPCDTELSNRVAQYAAGVVERERDPDSDPYYVIVVGTDEDIPFLAHIDRTSIGNASQYQEAFILPGAQLAKINEGLMDTDAHLCGNSVPFQGGKWFIPDCIVSRWVESADDIEEAVDTFVANPHIDLTGRVHVDAYDFLSDGATAVATTLNATDTLIDDPANDNDGDPDVWNADDARCKVLGVPASDPACSVPNLSYINGHMTHAVWLAALGFKEHLLDDIVTSLDVGLHAFQNRAVLSVGCHFALSVADSLGFPAEAGLPWDSGIDWMQRIVGSGGAAIGSTDFGLGESEGIAGHEELMLDIAHEIADGAPTIGQAWLGGIHSFVLRQFDPSEYHQKVVETTALYGPPHYQFTRGAAVQAAAAAASVTPTAQVLSETGGGTSVVDLDDGAGSLTQPHDLTKVTVDNGEYLRADPGGFSAAVGSALQPRNSFPLTLQNPGIAKGVLIRGGHIEDFPDWDPVIATRDYDWNEASVEPLVCKSNYSPSIPAWVNSVPQGDGFLQAANVSLGQFRCTEPSTGVGVERVWRDMQLEVTRCAAGAGPIDFVPPHVTSQLLRVVNGNDVELTLEASDASGISSINVLVIRPDGTVETFDRDVSSETSPYTISVPDALDQELFWQVEDNNCNVFNGTFKGLLATAIRVEAPDGFYSAGIPTTLTATVFDYASLVAETTTFLWDFGDGTTSGGLLDPLVGDPDSDGNVTFGIKHTYDEGTADPVTATLIVSDASGASGTDTATLTSCGDPEDLDNSADADLRACGFERVSQTRAAASMFVRGAITNDFQYRTRVNDVLMKWDRNKVTGPDSLVVTKVGNNGLRFEFDLVDVNWSTTSDNTVDWHTQAGVKGKKAQGFPDDMPDEGSLVIGQ